MQDLKNDQDILLELKKNTKLLSLIATQGKSQNEKIVTLSQVGFSPKEIAELIGTSANVVSVMLHKNKNKSKKKK